MLAIEGIPIFYLELAIGQRLRKGAIGVWNQVNRRGKRKNNNNNSQLEDGSKDEKTLIYSSVLKKVSPYMGGIGISSAVVSFNVALYYNTIIAWCLFYFVQVRDPGLERSTFFTLSILAALRTIQRNSKSV